MNKIELLREGEADGVKLMTYSGRCMYGQRCMAYSLDSGVSVFQPFDNMLEYVHDNFIHTDNLHAGIRRVKELLADAQWDQLGRGVVLYFPSVDCEGCDDE